MRLSAAVLVLLLALSGHAAAQADKRLPVNQRTTDQKAMFIENLVRDSASSRTISESGDTEALAALDEARELVAAARSDLDGGDYAAADGKLNQALALVTSHTQRLSKGDIQARQQARRYDTLHGSVLALKDALARVAVEDGAESGQEARDAEIAEGLAEAEGLQQAGKTDEAIAVLRDTYDKAAGHISDLREGKTVVARLVFETPEDEYLYEIDRHDSHRYLLALALGETTPHPSFVKEITRLEKQSNELRGKAEAFAAEGRFDAGIHSLDQATGQLINAIRMAGIYIP